MSGRKDSLKDYSDLACFDLPAYVEEANLGSSSDSKRDDDREERRDESDSKPSSDEDKDKSKQMENELIFNSP